MIETASWDFNAFKVNNALKRVWRGTSPLVLQRQASRDLSLSGVGADMSEIRSDNLLSHAIKSRPGLDPHCTLL